MFTIPLAQITKWRGKRLSSDAGWSRTQGECATGVQYVFYKAGKPLGYTRSWKQGKQVKGGNVPAGTAIASFQNGRFAQDHAAVFIRETAEGLEVWDQYNHPSKPWGPRTLYFNRGADRSNGGNNFYVITK